MEYQDTEDKLCRTPISILLSTGSHQAGTPQIPPSRISQAEEIFIEDTHSTISPSH